MMSANAIWILFAGCLAFVGGQDPLELALPPTMRVERNWFVLPTDPIGTVVTRVHQTSGSSIRYGLETIGPPVPFRIDSVTGVVYVNDTLRDKENQSFSLWVTAYDGSHGSLPQKTEVFATITDITGQTPRVPRPPPFQIPGHPQNFPPNYPFPGTLNIPQPNLQLNPKYPIVQKTTADPDGLDDVTLESTTTSTLGPPKRPEDIIDKTYSNDYSETPDVRPNVTNDVDPATGNEVAFTIIPLVAIAGLVVIVTIVIVVVWKKNNIHKTKSKKDDMSKDASGIVLQDAVFHHWERPRACSNRYESWDTNHLQLSEETSVTKEEPKDEWEFPRHKLRIYNIVGEGAFGQVWRAQATDIDGKKGETTVAVKTLKENAAPKEKADLLQELIVMKGLGTHPNVVRLLGCCTEKEPTFVIMEFVSLGKLQSFLRDSRAERHYGNTHGGSRSLTSRDLTHFAYQVARGMDFLSEKGIIHRDLAARNVLITEEKTCKVADFGFARDVAGTHVYERKSDGRLPIRWMAPESLYDDIFSMKSDIWSFGVLLWEIVTLGSTPYPGLSAGDVMRKVRDGHRLEKPEHCRRELYNIMYYCWEAEPSSRPDFAECVSLLERLLCTETDYIELERFPDHSYYNVQHLEGEKL